METNLKGYVYAVPSTSADMGFELEVIGERHLYYMSDESIKLKEISCYVNLPELDRATLAQKALDTLRDKQQRTRAEAERTCQRLEKHIQKLLLLPYVDGEPDPDFVFEEEKTDDIDLPF